MKLISIIIPTYNEEGNLTNLIQELQNILLTCKDYTFELIFINDGSTDNTLNILTTVRNKYSNIQIISFTKNFGSHAAIFAGLKYCQGKSAIVFTADLQDPPSLVRDMLCQWENGVMVVWGTRKNRPGTNFISAYLTRLTYRLISIITSIKLPAYGTDIVMIDRVVIDAVNSSYEKNASYVMTIAWLGFPSKEIAYSKIERKIGRSKWTIWKKLKLLIDTTLPFSYVPLRLMSLIGITFSIIGFCYGTFIIVRGFFGFPIMGWASLMTVILLIGGCQILMLGILGEYIWRSYDESRARPKYIITQNTLTMETINK